MVSNYQHQLDGGDQVPSCVFYWSFHFIVFYIYRIHIHIHTSSSFSLVFVVCRKSFIAHLWLFGKCKCKVPYYTKNDFFLLSFHNIISWSTIIIYVGCSLFTSCVLYLYLFRGLCAFLFSLETYMNEFSHFIQVRVLLVGFFWIIIMRHKSI
jgi:hypothetical protein